MRVILQRNLFMGGVRYRRDRYGTEVPDEVDGKKIILFDEKLKDDPTVMMLPRDTRLYEGEPDEHHPRDLISRATATRPTALSELTPRGGKHPHEVELAAKTQKRIDKEAEATAATRKVPTQEDEIAKGYPEVQYKSEHSKEPITGQPPPPPIEPAKKK